MESSKLALGCVIFAIITFFFGVFVLSEMGEIKHTVNYNASLQRAQSPEHSDNCMIDSAFPVKDGMELLMRHLGLDFERNKTSHKIIKGDYPVRMQCKEGC